MRAAAALRGAAIPLAALVLWEALARRGLVPEQTVSHPSAIAAAWLVELRDGSLVRQTAETLQTAAGAWLGACAAAVLCGALVGLSAPLRRVTALTIEALRPIPGVALIPVALLAFGFGYRLEASVVAFVVFWPVLLLTAAGVRAVDQRLLEVSRMLRLSLARRLTKIVLPAALPSISVGLRIAAGLALVVAVTVEIVVNPRGLGYAMIVSSQNLRPDIVYADLAWLGVVGFAINALFTVVERRVFARFYPGRAEPS